MNSHFLPFSVLDGEETYDSAVNFDLMNVVMPINVENLERLLTDSKYNQTETEFLVQGFKFGFDLGYEGPVLRQSK